MRTAKSVLLSKTDLVIESSFYETHLDYHAGHEITYCIKQSTNGVGAVSADAETLFFNREQAIQIALTILIQEGMLPRAGIKA